MSTVHQVMEQWLLKSVDSNRNMSVSQLLVYSYNRQFINTNVAKVTDDVLIARSSDDISQLLNVSKKMYSKGSN